MTRPHIEATQYYNMENVYTRPDGRVEVYRGDVDGHDTIIKIGANEQVVESLKHEAEVLEKLQGSEHAPALYDIGYNEETAKTYLAMEYVTGDKLDETLEMNRQWEFPSILPESAVNLTVGIAHADKDFMDRGVFYRDVNLNHIIIKPDGKIAFIDFGAAEISPNGSAEWEVTDDERNGGTWEFMAPEEFHPGNAVNEATAVYRLGVIGHMLLTGRLPVPRFDEIDQATAWSEDPHFELSNRLTEEGAAFFHKIFSDRVGSIQEFIKELTDKKDRLVVAPWEGAREIRVAS